MNTIIFFNHNNITNIIDKTIFEQYYPNEIFINFNPSDIDSQQKLTKQIEQINAVIQGETCCLPFCCSTVLEYPFSENNLIKLFDAEYIMFLKSKFFKKKSLLDFFDKYNVVYLNYKHKDKIIYTLKMINYFIKNAHLVDKIKFISDVKIHNLNQIFLSNNEMEPNILYKKISFSNQDLFLPFNTYTIKKIEYKLRTFCQIAEKLGAEKIIIKYDSQFLSENKLIVNANVLSNSAKVESSTTLTNNLGQTIDMIFQYPNNGSNITLNKFNVVNLIVNESEFFIQSDEFNADIDLKFLLDARCINLIQKYNTNFIINCMNEIEQSIMLTSSNYGVGGSYKGKTSSNIQININIDFLNIYSNPSCIDGSNLYMGKEGYAHLVGIINEEIRLLIIDSKDSNNETAYNIEITKNTYKKINNYIRSYFDYLTKQKINNKNIKTVSGNNNDNLNIDSNENVDLIEAYHYIIDLNFNDDEIKELFYDYFNNNLNYYNFELFISILSKGYQKKIDKLTFISHQYHIILQYNFNLTNIINHQIYKIFENLKNLIHRYKLNKINNISNKSKFNKSKINKSKFNESNIKKSFVRLEYLTLQELFSNEFINNIKISDIIFDFMLNDLKLPEFISNIFSILLTHRNGLMYSNNIDELIQLTQRIIIDKKKIIDNMIILLKNKLNIIFNHLNNFINYIVNDIIIGICSYQQNENKTLTQILINFYNKYLSDYLNKHFNVYDKMEQLNQKFKNNIPRNDIPLCKMHDNYSINKLFYTWNDFMNTFNGFIMIDQLPTNTNKDLIPISYCRLNDLMLIEKFERDKFKLVQSSSLNNDIQLYYGPLYMPGLTKSNYTNFNNIDPSAQLSFIDQDSKQNINLTNENPVQIASTLDYPSNNFQSSGMSQHDSSTMYLYRQKQQQQNSSISKIYVPKSPQKVQIQTKNNIPITILTSDLIPITPPPNSPSLRRKTSSPSRRKTTSPPSNTSPSRRKTTSPSRRKATSPPSNTSPSRRKTTSRITPIFSRLSISSNSSYSLDRSRSNSPNITKTSTISRPSSSINSIPKDSILTMFDIPIIIDNIIIKESLQTPDNTPNNTPDNTPNNTTNNTLNNTPDNTPNNTLNNTLNNILV